MTLLTIFANATLVLLAFYAFQRTRHRGLLASKYDCQPPPKLRSFEPFFGFDIKLSMHMDIPSLYRHHQKFGKTFEVAALLSTPEICTIAKENIRELNSGKSWGIEPMRLPGMEYLCGRGFLTTDGEMWNHSRKLLKPSFSKNNLLDLSTLSSELDKLLNAVPNDGSSIDLQPGLSNMFLATSMNFLLGILPSDTGHQAPQKPESFIEAFHDAIFRTMFRVMLGKLWILVPKAKYLNNCKISHEFIDFYVKEALNQKDCSATVETNDNLKQTQKHSMIRSLSEQTDDRVHIRSQILQGMLASGETISALLGNTILLLSRHPSYWQQIRDEGKKGGSEVYSFDSLHDCKLVQNILRESLRLYPVFPLLARVALSDTTLPVGGGKDQKEPIFVPQGTLVVMSYYALHRDPSIFGDDVEEFRPERWNDIHPDQWEFIPFGAGQRACLGQHKVMVEAAYVLLRMAERFKTLECRDEAPWKGELKLTCKSANGCKVALQRE